eukprot:Transcript_7491.p1 GENE.Transcript_7491~~Transcript_7491.p1  ORF type:complete len:366 (+),score=80.15 Transcript_7491:107-1204(+)
MLLHAPQECLVPLEQRSLDPVEQECKAILKQLVEAVATRHVVAEQATLLAELEDYQAQCWTRDEARHRERQRLRALAAAPASQPHHSARARSPAEGMRRAQRSESPSARSAQGSESSDASVQGALRPRRRAKLRSLSAQVDADFSALANRMQALGVGVQPSPQPPRPSRSSGGDGGGSGRPGGSAGSSASAGGGAAAPVGAAPRRIGSCGGVIDVPRRGGGQRVGRAGAPGAPPPPPPAAPLDDRAYVETLLPSAPPGRSQFVFEVEAPIQSHAQSQDSVHDRLLQRRLALLAGLQHETVRLERKQRQENAGKVRSNLVYSTGLSAAESMREGGSGTGAKPMHHAGSAARPFQPGLWRPAHPPPS